MRRAPAWVVVVGVAVAMGGFSAEVRAADGFWVTLASGASGSSSPSDYNEFWFDSPHAPPIAVNQLSNGLSVQATTGGGSTFFSGIGTPVLLPTGDGYATLSSAGSSVETGGLPRFAGDTQASGAPLTSTPLGNANLLSVGLSSPATSGSQVLTVGATDSSGNALGNTQVTIPNGGWWVIGLGNGASDSNTGTGSGGGGDGGGSPVTVPVPPSTGGTGGGSGTVATPEPATLVLFGVGGLAAAGYRRLRRA